MKFSIATVITILASSALAAPTQGSHNQVAKRQNPAALLNVVQSLTGGATPDNAANPSTITSDAKNAEASQAMDEAIKAEKNFQADQSEAQQDDQPDDETDDSSPQADFPQQSDSAEVPTATDAADQASATDSAETPANTNAAAAPHNAAGGLGGLNSLTGLLGLLKH